ncbi:MAG TPA: NUDIX domain-containing protein [Candidatus Alistipes excrementipullorum]|nr:NUDIX domain-containing protein [Candidatus Alistipes excrementipullorum]
MIGKTEIYEQLRRLTSPVDPRFTELVARYGEADLCNRRNFEGHLTASGVIVRMPEREVLLLRHRSLGKWLAPGGHTEAGDTSAAAAALREIVEETGIEADMLVPTNVSDGVQYCVEVSSHVIPRNEARGEEEHMHHDFRFLFAYTGSRTIRTDERESAGYEWLPLDDEYVRREILCTERADALLEAALEGL